MHSGTEFLATHRFEGYVVEQIGRYKIIEGVGPWGGSWAARERGNGGELVEFNSRKEAEEHARLSNEAILEDQMVNVVSSVAGLPKDFVKQTLLSNSDADYRDRD